MALISLFPIISPLSTYSLLSHRQNLIRNLSLFSSSSKSYPHPLTANCSKRETSSADNSAPSALNEELLRRVSGARDADQAMEMIVEAKGTTGGGFIDGEGCHSILAAAIDRGNADLALSVFHAMHSGYGGNGLNEKISSVGRWMWARPDVTTYALLVRGLAASLRVSDAIRIIAYVSRAGVSFGDEVPFGTIVQCPICMIPIAVAQPQHGIQVARCSKCRYQYELISGDIVSIDSEVIRIFYCRTQHGHFSMAKGSEVSTDNERESSCCSPFHRGQNSFRDCSYT